MRQIKLKEYKRVSKVVTNEMVQELFTAPVYESKWFTPDNLCQVKQYLEEDTNLNKWLVNSKIDPNLKLAIESLKLYNNDKLVHVLNTIDGNRDYENVIVGKLMDRLDIPSILNIQPFQQYQIKAYMAYQLVQILADLNLIIKKEELSWHVDEETGRGEWKTSYFLTFGTPKTSNPFYVKGIHREAGRVMQKAYKVQAGGKARKLSKTEKEFLSMASSFKVKLVDIDLKVLEEYMKTSAWYTQVLKGAVNMDIIQADELVYQTLEIYNRMKHLDGFYMSMWLDYRTRLYYDFTQLGMNPHGKHFETSLFESYDSYNITEINEYLYSAVVLVEGRMSHHEAVEKYLANSAYYQEALRDTSVTHEVEGIIVPDHGEILYNTRLADAIEAYYNNEPTHFLLGEDATNGGLQHGGIGFHSEEMMKPANVGGLPTQEDSHGNLQTILGLSSRSEAKDIHQPLLHGSTIRTVAHVVNKTIREAEEMLLKAYGKSVFNIEAIANWGVAAANNQNTTLMWKTRDGFNAQSIAYVESVPLNLKAVTNSTTKGWCQTKVVKDMPLLLDRQGNPVYGKISDTNKKTGGDVKVRGLYANITHSIDATSLRDIIRATKGRGLWKHDNFLVPGTMTLVRQTYRKALLAEFDGKLYENALVQIVDNYTGTAPSLPKLVYGTATKDMIINSHYYLAP